MIENLSNELFYEIFDYLNGLDIYRSFYQLNHRFNELLIQSSILYKIKLSSDSTLDLFQSTSVLDSKISSLSCSHDVPVNKIFINRSFPNLQSIHFTAYAEDKDYLNAIRWEQLISKNLTCLDQFHFHYTELYYDDFEVTAKHELLKGFASPFWKERQWSLSLSVIEYEIIYRITPLKYSFILKFLRYFILIFFYLHRKSSFSTHHRYHLMNDWTPLSIWHSVLAKKDQRFMTNFSQLIKTLGITFLNIDCSRVSPMTLLNLFNCVQNLHSIRISSLPLKTKLLKANLDQWNLFIENNKIIYVTLPNVSDLKRFDLILEFFPLMKHLTLNIDSPDDFEEAVQSVLSKLKKRKNHNINSICFIVAEIENDKIPQLEKLIDSKKLVKNFTFTREYENFYLKFK